MKYRPEIDGLRAVAVLPVIAFHGGLPWLPGGYAGVDVFFAISGFLITTILIEDQARGQLSVLSFYERRARRILPALLFVCLACLPFAWAWMLPAQLSDFFRSLMAVALFISNFHFLEQAGGYFSPDLELQPLLHTWSLSVEEQFYLFFPLLLFVFRKARVLVGVIVTLTLASFLLALWGNGFAPDQNFFFSPSRFWELFAGALVAFALRSGRPARFSSDMIAAPGLVLILAAMVLHRPSSGYPGVLTLLPVLGTALILVGAHRGTFIARILAAKPLVAIGLISYSAYLWHQPVFAFARIRALQEPPPGVMALLALLSLGLAWATWRYVEQPFRRRANRRLAKRGWLFLASGIGLAAFISVGAIGMAREGYPERFAHLPIAQRVAQMNTENARLMAECHFGNAQTAPTAVSIPACNTRGNAPLDAVIIGDSHLSSLRVALFENAGDLNIGTFAFGACPPVPGLSGDRANGCDTSTEARYQAIEADPVPVVVLLARWSLYSSGTGFDNSEGGHETKILPYHAPGFEGARDEGVRQAYAAAIDRLTQAGKTVVLVYPIPEAGWHVADRLVLGTAFGRADIVNGFGTDLRAYDQRHAPVVRVFDALPDEKLARLRPDEIFCDTLMPGRCANTADGLPLYSDDDHLSLAGARMLAPALVSLLMP